MSINAANHARHRQYLVFDADDTLWENNIYFEQAIAEFIAVLDHSTLSHADVRAVLDEIEHVNVPIHGYGAVGFARSLTETYHRLAERHISDDDLAHIRALGERILTQEKEILPGVVETLTDLAQRHDLGLLTKGDQDEQRIKVESSGLAGFFSHLEIVPEKHTEVYRNLIPTLGSSPSNTWMIGNSPRSDINPALAAGLNGVFIPHSVTWHREIEEITRPTDPARLLILERFPDLTTHF